MDSIPFATNIFQALGLTSSRDILTFLSLGMVAIIVLKNAANALTNWIIYRFRVHAELSLTRSLLRAYFDTPYAIMLRRNSSELIVNVMSTVPTFFAFIVINGFRLLTEVVMVLTIVALMITAEPLLTLSILTAFIGSLSVIGLLLRRRLRAWGKLQVELTGERQRCLAHCFGALREIKVMGAEGFFVGTYSAVVRRLMPLFIRIQMARDLPRVVIEIIMVVTIATLVITLVFMGRSGSEIVALLGLFAAASFRLLPYLNRIYGGMNEMRINWPAITLVGKDFTKFYPDSDFRTPSHPRELLPFQHSIHIDRVSYTYPESQSMVINDIDFTIAQGESVALVGPSGSGKSTTADLLLGLLQPKAGRITVDGRDIHDNIRAWQNLIGMVPQSIFLTDDTLRCNIAFGLNARDIDEDKIWKVLRMVRLDEFVAELPDGLSTMVGERGARLSGGQRQRLGIARALYRDPQLLIFDEATAALDMESELGITKILGELSGSHTVVVIAHRLSTVRNCDKIIFLTEGGIKGIGTYDALQASNADFARMVQLSQSQSEMLP